MQQPTSLPHSWREFVWLSLVAVAAYFARSFPSLFRRKPTQIETEKARAEIRNLDAESIAQTGGFMVDLMRASAQATLDVERIRAQMEFQRSRADGLELERDDLRMRSELQVIELTMRDRDIKKLKAMLDVHGIKFSEFDEHPQ